MHDRRQVWNYGLRGLFAGSLLALAPADAAEEAPPGLVLRPSNYSANETGDRLEAAIALNGSTLFARYALERPGSGTTPGRRLEILIFGDPKALMPILANAPAAALDLPIKAVVFEDEAGKVWVTYNSADHLRQRFNLPDALMPAIDEATQLIEAVLS